MKKYFLTFTIILYIILLTTTPSFADNRFNDVDQNAYYYDSVMWAVEEGITDGTTKTTFSPQATCTRAQVVTFLWRSFGRPEPKNKNNPFKDVREGSYYYSAVLWAVENGITNGTSATAFSPNKTCTQGQILSFLYRSQGEPKVMTSDKYTGKYYQNAVTWAEKYGVLAQNFNPNSPCPRADVVTYMNYTQNGEQSNPIDFEELKNDINTQRTTQINNTESFSGFENYLKHKSGEVQISKEELDSLLQHHPYKSILSTKEAMADISLYFRALKYGYAGYYYFGEDAFKTAEENITNELNGKNSINTEDLEKLLHTNLQFVCDAHFSINGWRTTDNESIRYEYYYADQYFSRDELGYYQTYYGQKWYYSGCGNKNVEIAPYLNDDGILVYSPVQFCPASIAKTKDSVELANGSQKRTIIINWRLSESNDTYRVPDYHFLNENGIVYLSVRVYNDYFSDILNQYAEDAKACKNAKLIIYDTRGNGGGSDSYARKWIENYSGQKPEIKEVFSNWQNYLWGNVEFGSESYGRHGQFMLAQGKMIDNEIPVIFLTDDKAGSAGESVLNFTKTLKNCIVIGTNSAGYQLCGNVKNFTLPNSGLSVNFSQNLSFHNTMENVDAKGYKPDVWCNSKTALGAVMRMLNNYDLADKKTTTALLDALGLDKTGVDEQIYFKFDNGFRTTEVGMRDQAYVWIEYKGNIITDYSFSNSDNNVLTVMKDSRGRLQLKKNAPGKSIITITTGSKTQDFLVTCNP